MTPDQYNKLRILTDAAKERLDKGNEYSHSGIHYELISVLGELGVVAMGRQDSVKQATILLEQYERETFGTSSSDDKYLNMF
jgi:hypothetical protein